MSDLLNPGQLWSVEVTLSMFEENLLLTTTWLDGAEENGILHRRKQTLPPEQRRAARRPINAALEQIATLARTLDLPADENDAARMILGRLAVSWANLIDSQSRKLKRYGDVDPWAERILDPAIQRMGQVVQELESLFEG